jgi:asparagine synthase (glutamine-hydrolysing)
MTWLAALRLDGGRPEARLCDAMLRAQAGDAAPTQVRAEGAIALGTAGGSGPVVSACGRFSLIADARLDNRPDFIAPLGLTGSDAPTDVGLMMLCIERWGIGVIDRFVGDFALALWDEGSGQLSLARDFAGQRPLHFHERGGTVAVASMAKGLHALDFVPRSVDETRLIETLASLPHEGRRTFFEHVERVEPGEVLTLRRGGRSARIFWSAPSGEIRLRSPGDYAEALIEKLDQAVDARLRDSGATVATQLSAGLDSSAVTSSAALRFPGRVLAFTSVPPAGELPPLPAGRFGDEGALAAETARLYANIEHRLIDTGARLPLEDLDWQLDLFERPDLNLPNLAWANRINDAALAKGIGVMLIGTMGNTSLSYGGYERLGELLRSGRIGAFLAESAAARKAGMKPRALFGEAARAILPPPLFKALGRFRNRGHYPALAGVLNPGAPGYGEILERFERNEAPAAGGAVEVRSRAIRRVDPGTYNKGVLRRWGLDLRDPTADRRLVEFCLQVPLGQYFRDGVPRALIRAALAGRVPDSVRLEQRRGLQSPHWFAMLSAARDESRRRLAAIGESAAARRLLDLDKMNRLLEAWPDPSRSEGPAVYRYGFLRGIAAGEFIRLHSSRAFD